LRWQGPRIDRRGCHRSVGRHSQPRWASGHLDLSATDMHQMTPKISIRIVSGIGKIGAKQIAFLEAIQSKGSITQAGRFMGLSYRGARLLLEDINKVLCGPAVSAMSGGSKGGGAALTPVGTQLVRLYHAIEVRAQSVTLRGTCSTTQARASQKRLRLPLLPEYHTICRRLIMHMLIVEKPAINHLNF
jgi:molybdate transport system regulatory protein